ncbi:MAG: hypothetical protein Q8Q01_04255 [archaeon]|nr:hypothetical protein [archaeon]
MALFSQQQTPLHEDVQQLRQRGLSDPMITGELSRRGHPEEHVQQAISDLDNPMPPPAPGYGDDMSYGAEMPVEDYSMPASSMSSPRQQSAQDGNLYERIEEITEQMIDEKWDELINEVKKIIEWKNKIEERQLKLQHDFDTLKEDFKVLYQGVLGKLEDYDGRMRDVGTELKAVGKVFKDVIPEFVDNVKEFSRLTESAKKKK